MEIKETNNFVFRISRKSRPDLISAIFARALGSDGIKSKSRGISGGKQATKFATTSNRRQGCSFCKNPGNYFKPSANAGYNIVETIKQKKQG